MARTSQLAALVGACILLAACDDKDKKPSDSAPEKITVKILINVLKGVTAANDETKPTRDKLKQDLTAAMKEAAKAFKDCGLELDFDPANINWDAENPDQKGSTDMDGAYDTDKATQINGKASDELKKKFGDAKKGFKLYLIDTLTHPDGESGKGYWFTDPPSPGFSLVEASHANSSRLLAHEISHGLGCLADLKDDKDKGNLMHPSGKVGGGDTALTKEQCDKLRDCASKRK